MSGRERPAAGGDDTDLEFRFRVRKSGEVVVLHRGRPAATLRGRKALDFVVAVESAGRAEGQRLMARVTGNYKRGNERGAGSHPRNRGS